MNLVTDPQLGRHIETKGTHLNFLNYFICLCLKHFIDSSLVVQLVKILPANAGDAGDVGLIPGSGRYPLEKEMAIHSSMLAWRIPWTKEPSRLQSMCLEKLDTT